LTTFALLAVFLTIVTVALVAWPLLRSGAESHPVAATVTALAIPATVLVAYLLVSNHDWDAAPGPPAPAAGGQAGSLEEAVAGLERKLAAEPADEEGWILLGSSYLSMSRPADAVGAYQKALEVSGGRSVEARLGVAEARIAMDPGALAGPVGEEIEAVLVDEPRNPKALWYGGLRSMARGAGTLAGTA
jgi:cytochrome c-type biogenesis protein CcmH